MSILKLKELIKTKLRKPSFKFRNDFLPKRINALLNMQNHRHADGPLIPIHGSQIYNKSFIVKSPGSVTK